jgi:hypothetical protein
MRRDARLLRQQHVQKQKYPSLLPSPLLLHNWLTKPCVLCTGYSGCCCPAVLAAVQLDLAAQMPHQTMTQMMGPWVLQQASPCCHTAWLTCHECWEQSWTHLQSAQCQQQ